MNSNNQRQQPAPVGLGLADIYYIIFRHKWLIVLLSAFGLIGGLATFALWPKVYLSEAKLYIPYVQENRTPRQLGNDSTVKMADGNIVNNELEILTSMDIALDVASNFGPKQILGKTRSESNNVIAAAGLIRKNFKAQQAFSRSDCLLLTFEHSDLAVPQAILKQIIESYEKKHSEMHHPLGENDEYFQIQIDNWHTALGTVDDDLRAKMSNANVISLGESEMGYATRVARLQQDIEDSEVELKEHEATINELNKLMGLTMKSAQVTATNGVTNNLAAKDLARDTNASVPSVPGNVVASNLAVSGATDPGIVPPEKLAEYQALRGDLENYQRSEQKWSMEFNDNNPTLKAVKLQIAQTQKALSKMEAENPGLLPLKTQSGQVVQTALGGGAAVIDPLATLRVRLQSELVDAAQTKGKFDELTSRLVEVKKQAADFTAAEGPISDLQTRKRIANTNYEYYAMSLEHSRADELLGPDKINKIEPLEQPTPPAIQRSKAVTTSAGIFIACLVTALGFAFLKEIYLDNSLKNAKEVEARLAKPLFLSIPWLNGNGKAHGLNGARIAGLLAENASPAGASTPAAGTVSPPAVAASLPEAISVNHGELRPFYETLRDRLISYFEAINLTHKPKLVAVCGCHDKAGVTTIAAGLAESFSETGDGRVLLVDMNGQNGKAHHFYKGQLRCGLDEVLQKGGIPEAQVQENLYVALEVTGSDRLPRVLPKRFSHLVPQMKASDFDYIIFDMPPVSQISPTPRLARFMDMVLMVVESEKTDRALAGRAMSWLSESKSNIGLILNKKRSYVPKWLLPEL